MSIPFIVRRGRHFTGRSVYHPVTAVTRAGVSARRPLPPSYLPPPVLSEEVFIGRADASAAASFFPITRSSGALLMIARRPPNVGHFPSGHPPFPGSDPNPEPQPHNQGDQLSGNLSFWQTWECREIS